MDDRFEGEGEQQRREERDEDGGGEMQEREEAEDRDSSSAEKSVMKTEAAKCRSARRPRTAITVAPARMRFRSGPCRRRSSVPETSGSAAYSASSFAARAASSFAGFGSPLPALPATEDKSEDKPEERSRSVPCAGVMCPLYRFSDAGCSVPGCTGLRPV